MIIAGSGHDTISIIGNGNNGITAGTGPLDITLSGDGNNLLLVDGASPPAINGSVTTIADPNYANNGSFTFQFLHYAEDSFNGTLTGDGEFDVMGGHLVMHGGESFTGDVGILSATLELTSANVIGTGPITFLPSPAGQLSGTLQIDGASMPSNVIKGFTPNTNTIIDLRGVSFTGQGAAKLLSGNILDVVQNANDNNSPHYSLHLDPSYDFSPYHFALSDDGMGGTNIVLAPSVNGVDTGSIGKDVSLGGIVTIYLDLGEALKVSGSPLLVLNDGGTAIFDAKHSDLANGLLAFAYKVGPGQAAADLQIDQVNLGKGAAVTNLSATTPTSP